MAITQTNEPEKKRLDLPLTLPGVAAGDWVEIVTTYTAGMRRHITERIGISNAADFDIFQYKQFLLEEIITAWSDEAPVSAEAIGSMHAYVQDWITQAFDHLQVGMSEDEKKSSETPSSPTSITAGRSRKRSGT